MIKTVYEHIYTINIQFIEKYWIRMWRSGTLTNRKVHPMPITTYCPSSPCASYIYIHLLINHYYNHSENIKIIHTDEECRKGGKNTINTTYYKIILNFLYTTILHYCLQFLFLKRMLQMKMNSCIPRLI